MSEIYKFRSRTLDYRRDRYLANPMTNSMACLTAEPTRSIADFIGCRFSTLHF